MVYTWRPAGAIMLESRRDWLAPGWAEPAKVRDDLNGTRHAGIEALAW